MEASQKRVVLITGASSGLGKACAEHLHQRGHRVYGTSRSPHLHPGTPFELIELDVNRDDSVRRAIALIVEREGRIDVVVNNAGLVMAGAIEDTSVGDARAQFETNFLGVLRVCRAVLPIMRGQGGGYIIHISSIAGLIAIPFQGMYSASKYAIEGMTEALSAEVRPFGIRVVLIEPGDYPTGNLENREWTPESQENPIYLEQAKRAVGIMENDERHGSDPRLFARLVERIIHCRSPRLRYRAGSWLERLFVLLKKILPGRIFEWGLMKYYKVL